MLRLLGWCGRVRGRDVGFAGVTSDRAEMSGRQNEAQTQQGQGYASDDVTTGRAEGLLEYVWCEKDQAHESWIDNAQRQHEERRDEAASLGGMAGQHSGTATGSLSFLHIILVSRQVWLMGEL